MKFADLVVVVFVGRARLGLSALIARYKGYKLERQRYRWGASAQKQLSTAFVEVRVRDGREASVGENTWPLKPIAAAGNSVEQERRWTMW